MSELCLDWKNCIVVFSRCHCPTFCAGSARTMARTSPGTAATSPGAQPGKVLCSVLRVYSCAATGDNAHTLKYCPKNKDWRWDRFLIYSEKQAARKARNKTREIRQWQGKTSSSLFWCLSCPGTTTGRVWPTWRSCATPWAASRTAAPGGGKLPLATVNKGGRVVTAEGWVILGRGGGAKFNLQEQHLRLVAYFFANDPPEVCVEDEYYNSGKWPQRFGQFYS